MELVRQKPEGPPEGQAKSTTAEAVARERLDVPVSFELSVGGVHVGLNRAQSLHMAAEMARRDSLIATRLLLSIVVCDVICHHGTFRKYIYCN
jgi:hypothetical protein